MCKEIPRAMQVVTVEHETKSDRFSCCLKINFTRKILNEEITKTSKADNETLKLLVHSPFPT